MSNTMRGGKPEKATTKRKAAGGYHTTTTAIKISAQTLAPSCKKRHTAPKCCATFQSTPELLGLVLENTVIDSGAFTHALSWVFSRPNTLVYGRDGLVRKAGRMAESMFSTSRPPVALEKAACGFQSHSGAETMTNVISLTSRKASHNAATTAITTTPALGHIERQQAIENALSMALFYVRTMDTQQGIHAAMAKAMRAATMLKQACTESTISGRA